MFGLLAGAASLIGGVIQSRSDDRRQEKAQDHADEQAGKTRAQYLADRKHAEAREDRLREAALKRAEEREDTALVRLIEQTRESGFNPLTALVPICF